MEDLSTTATAASIPKLATLKPVEKSLRDKEGFDSLILVL